MKPIEVLLVTKSEELKKSASHVLIEHFRENLLLNRIESMEDASERVEKRIVRPELVVIDLSTSTVSELKLLFDRIPGAATIVVHSATTTAETLKPLEDQTRFIPLPVFDTEFPILLKKFETSGKIKLIAPPPDEYVAISADQVLAMHPLPVDVYLKLGSGKTLRVFQKGENLSAKDIAKYPGQQLYLTRVECDLIFKAQVQKIEAISNATPLDVVQAKKVATVSQELVRTLIADVGFTEEAQRIAKASVNMSLKLIATKPRLSTILQELKKKEGNFVTSHSFLLGQLSCAMAYTVGWNSASTYFKLSMAAFLHDIALNINTEEQEVTYDAAERSGLYTPEELKILKFHPIKAAEYTRQFSEIPADVEQIVAQHHERPDGSGYPRGMAAKYVSPLSAIFIIAHDLILFMMKHPDVKVEKFYEIVEKDFQQNPFRKIITALRTETKIIT